MFKNYYKDFFVYKKKHHWYILPAFIFYYDKDEYFEDGKEIVFYEHGNLEDLKSKIDKYLDSSLDRERIRLGGHERTKKDHTYVHRWKEILKELGI